MIFKLILFFFFNLYLNFLFIIKKSSFFFFYLNFSKNFYILNSISNFKNYITFKNFNNYNIFYNFNTNIKLKKNSNFFFFSYFLNNYFINKIKNTCYLYFFNFNYTFLEHNKYYNWIINNIKKLSYNFIFNNNLRYLPFLLKTVIFFIHTKDTYFLTNWIKFFFESIYFKNHKKLLILLKYIFYFFYKYFKIYLNFKGLLFLIKGKINLSGNSKKKSFKFKFGNYSLNKKNILFNFNKNHINTLSGVLGFYVFIFF